MRVEDPEAIAGRDHHACLGSHHSPGGDRDGGGPNHGVSVDGRDRCRERAKELGLNPEPLRDRQPEREHEKPSARGNRGCAASGSAGPCLLAGEVLARDVLMGSVTGFRLVIYRCG